MGLFELLLLGVIAVSIIGGGFSGAYLAGIIPSFLGVSQAIQFILFIVMAVAIMMISFLLLILAHIIKR